jgi:hypothetical protein
MRREVGERRERAMGPFVHALQVFGLVVLNVVIGLLAMRGLLSLIAKLTDEEPALGCVGLPVLVLVMNVSLAAWTIAAA